MIEYDNEKEFNEVVAMLEPMLDFPMSADDVVNLKTNAIVSIAISLKRIADKMSMANNRPIIMSSKEYSDYLIQVKEAYDAGVAAIRKSATP